MIWPCFDRLKQVQITRSKVNKIQIKMQLLLNNFCQECPVLVILFGRKAMNWEADIFSSPEQNAQVSYCRPFSSVVRRPSSVVRRPSSVVRRPSSVNFLHFHLLLENAWLDFNQTWQESSLGVGDSKLFKSYVWPPWGPRGRPPKGQNHANFKHLLLQIQKENGQVM